MVTQKKNKKNSNNDALADYIVNGHRTGAGNDGGGEMSDLVSVTSTASHRKFFSNPLRRLLPKHGNNNNNSGGGGGGGSHNVSHARKNAGTTNTTTPSQANNNGKAMPSPPAASATTPMTVMSSSTSASAVSPISLASPTSSTPVKLLDTFEERGSAPASHKTGTKKTPQQMQPVVTGLTFGKEGVGTTKRTPKETTGKALPLHQQEQPERPDGNSHPSTVSSSFSSSWFTRTRAFQDLCNKVFDMVDTDDSGAVDEKELYSGLLLIHLQLGMYVGPAACKPIGRERCHKVFNHFDEDQTGTLNRSEFAGVMMVLFSNVIVRVLAQWSLTIIIVPMIAQRVLEFLYATMAFGYLCVIHADRYSSIANTMELTVEAALQWTWERTPGWMVVVCAAIVDWWQAVPDSVWNAAPLALISTILGVLVVPYCIFKVDDFFQYLAQRADKDHKDPPAIRQAENEKTPKKAETSIPTTPATPAAVKAKKTS